jgi:hypothetical protein
VTDLAERYGAPSRAGRLLVLAAVGVLAVAALAWLVWVMLAHSRPQVTSELLGYQIRGEHAVTATFTVTRRDPDVRASCLLRAVADDHAVVGERVVAVRSGAEQARRVATMRTERKATTVDLVGCSAQGQEARR